MNRKLLAIVTILVVALTAVSAATIINAQPRVVGAVYTIDNAAAGNNVLQFTRMSDGTLMATGMVPTQGLGTGAKLASQGAVTLSDDGMWLFVVNAGSNEVSVFRVNGNNLTWVSKASSQGMAPISVTVKNNWVYVLNNGSATAPGNIAGFMLNQMGQLVFIGNQPLSGMPNSAPEQIGFNPMGNILVVTEKAANVTNIYTVDSNGMASAPIVMPSLSPGPYGFAFTSTGILVLSEAVSNTMSSFAVNDNGSMRILSGSMPDFGTAPCWVTITADDQFAYTANGPGTISGYAITDSGILILFSSIAAKLDAPAFDLALSTGSEFLYSLNGNNITGFQVFPDGSLWQLTNVPNLPPATTGLAAT